MSNIQTSVESALRLKSLICLKSSTLNSREHQPEETFEMEIGKNIKHSAGKAIVDVALKVFSEDKSFEAEVVFQGTFELVGDFDDKTMRDMTERNTVAIMFPYVRSHMTLITAQPGLSPVVIPAININAIFDEDEKSETQSE